MIIKSKSDEANSMLDPAGIKPRQMDELNTESDSVTTQSGPSGAENASPEKTAALEESKLIIPAADKNKMSSRKKQFVFLGAIIFLLSTGWLLRSWIWFSFNTISTDDAYLDGHVTMVAPRVSGQVLKVLVDDNQRVKKGDLLLQLDPEPYKVEVEISQSQVNSAITDINVTRADVEKSVAQFKSAWFQLVHSMENVEKQLAMLRSNVALVDKEIATRVLAQKDLARIKEIVKSGAATPEELDLAVAKLNEAESNVTSAKEVVQENRTDLGLPVNIEHPLEVPVNLAETYSLVREAQANLLQQLSAVGYVPKAVNLSPTEFMNEIRQASPQGDLDLFCRDLISNAPQIKQAESKLVETQKQLASAELNLSYCNIYSEIDGVITRRNVNPGNYVDPGQSVMATRSLTEIWINANFKETQLEHLRIGHRVRVDFDMYGDTHTFNGRISGFSMGTGQTLALLPPQNATGNFIKIVQRLPVRIELTDYHPDTDTLFTGLSAVPYVFYKEPATGPNAGMRLQQNITVPSLTPLQMESK